MKQEVSNTVLAGQRLYAEHRAQKTYSVMDQDFAPQSIKEAYECQKVFMDLRAKTAGGYAGYKIGYTTPMMQQQFGITSPASGRILKSTVLPRGSALRAENFSELMIECEVAVRISNDLIYGPYDQDRIFAAVGEIMIAFEIIDRRPCLGPKTIEQSIATNIINAGAVLGVPNQEWRTLDIPGSECRLSVNGSVVGAGHGADVIGHPVLPVCWLADALHTRGDYLRRGDVVLTGSMIPPYALSPGDQVSLEMDNLGEIGISVQQ